jgi:hypothetical protein
MTEVKKEAGPAQHKIPVKHAGSLILPEIHAAEVEMHDSFSPQRVSARKPDS